MITAGGRCCVEEIKKVIKPANWYELYLFILFSMARFAVPLTVCNFNKYL